jgi:hypothetical protein
MRAGVAPLRPGRYYQAFETGPLFMCQVQRAPGHLSMREGLILGKASFLVGSGILGKLEEERQPSTG